MTRTLPLLVPLLAVSLSACADKPMRTGGPLPPAVLVCKADAGGWAVGQAAAADLVERVRNDTRSRIVRVIHPGEMITMDFNGERVDIRVDGANRILSVTCG